MKWMLHRKWKETKQQPGTAGPGNILGCCLVSLCFLCDIHSVHTLLLNTHAAHSNLLLRHDVVVSGVVVEEEWSDDDEADDDEGGDICAGEGDLGDRKT